MSNSWVHKLQQREIGCLRITDPSELPRPSGGVLILDQDLKVNSIPGGVLSHLPPDSAIHYLDLGGVQATSLLDFGGSAQLWAGITKLYASNSGLSSVDGMGHLTGVKYLYLDNNRLTETEMLKLCHELPKGVIEALDVIGNPGCEAALPALLDSGVLSRCDFLNGQRVRRTRRH